MMRRIDIHYHRLHERLFRCGKDGPCKLPWYGEAVRFVIMSTKVFNRNNVFMRSAAMAFISTIGIFPLAAVLLTMLPLYFSALGAEEALSPRRPDARKVQDDARNTQEKKNEILIAGSKTPVEAALSVAADISMRGPDEAATTTVTANSQYAKEVGDALVKAISPAGVDVAWRSSLEALFLNYRERSQSIGAIGIIGLFFGAVALFNTTQGAVNHIWKAKRERSFLQSMAVFSGVLVWLPLVVFLSLYLRNQLLRYSADAENFLAHVIPAAFALLFFSALYRYLPTVRVQWVSAMVGAVVCAVLWTIAKGTIANYVVHMRNIQNLILTVGTIPYFIVWMYVSWLILLLGVVVSYTHQNYHSLIALETEETNTVVDPVVLLVLLYVIGENFIEGSGGISYNGLRDSCPVSQPALNFHLTYLESHEYICQKAGTDAYILQKPAERIQLRDFLTLAPKAEHLHISDHVAKHDIMGFLLELDNAILGFLKNMSLDEMIKTFRTREHSLVCEVPRAINEA